MTAEGDVIAPESPDGLEDYEKLVEPRGETSSRRMPLRSLREHLPRKQRRKPVGRRFKSLAMVSSG